MSIKIIGIDPGLADTGVGIVTGEGHKVHGFAFGVVHTKAKDPPALRLEHIFDRLCALLTAEQPDVVVLEDVFSLEKYPRSGISLGQVCGVILLASRKVAATVHTIAVREAKQVLTGNGNAGKAQLEKAVRSVLGCSEPIRPYHASDALGLALIGLFRYAGPRNRHC